MVRITISIMTGVTTRTTIDTPDGAVHPRLLARSHELELQIGSLHSYEYISDLFAKDSLQMAQRRTWSLSNGKDGRAHHSCRRDERAVLRICARWNGADDVGNLMKMAASISSNAAMGKGVTEVQFTKTEV
jgi:isocitrate lyase